MSYILDALKKSDKERQRGAVPDIATVHEAVRTAPRRRTLWLYVVPAGLLLNAGIFIWWLSPWKPATPSITPAQQTVQQDTTLPPRLNENAPKEARPIERAAPKEAPVPPNQTEQNAGDPSETRGSKGMKPAEGSPQQRKEPSAPVKEQKKLVSAPADSPPRVSPPHTPEPDATPDHASAPPIPPPVPNKIYQISELPEPLRQSLPPFVISVALYGEEPAARMVRINDRVLREGQFLASGLRLDEIGRDSVILSYQNYRFRVGLK